MPRGRWPFWQSQASVRRGSEQAATGCTVVARASSALEWPAPPALSARLQLQLLIGAAFVGRPRVNLCSACVDRLEGAEAARSSEIWAPQRLTLRSERCQPAGWLSAEETPASGKSLQQQPDCSSARAAHGQRSSAHRACMSRPSIGSRRQERPRPSCGHGSVLRPAMWQLRSRDSMRTAASPSGSREHGAELAGLRLPQWCVGMSVTTWCRACVLEAA